MWNPWASLVELAHVRLFFTSDLPDGTFGHTDFGPPPTIKIVVGLTQAQRRSTLAHELVHLERGSLHVGGCVAREEDAVDREAACRLITWDALVEAMIWCHNEHELAEHLHVDLPMVIARLRALSERESRELMTLLDEAELRIP
jgi:hypothetical protein